MKDERKHFIVRDDIFDGTMRCRQDEATALRKWVKEVWGYEKEKWQYIMAQY